MTHSKKISVVIADDHPMFLKGVKQSLESDQSFSVVGEAGDGHRALQLLDELSPDVAIFDMNMPKMTGLAAAKEYKNKNGKTEIIFLTMFDDEDILNEAMDVGVKGYILKESASIDIVNAIRAVLQGKYYISPALTDKMLKRKGRLDNFESSHPQLQLLSEQERRILTMIADSKSSRQIAEELFLSPKTIDNYRFKISEKLKLSGSYSLLKFALENKKLL